ncbi:hypothetical protein BaRGS_00035377 [Batillaria attramentaria]|uniref:HTH psq-type domain-containing protein n=1 Tax=Batillaria attramentaria TaxID=370345 RepID=A0ABD0JEF7_9CAEN
MVRNDEGDAVGVQPLPPDGKRDGLTVHTADQITGMLMMLQKIYCNTAPSSSRYGDTRDLGYKLYSQEDLQVALEKVHWGMTVAEAASIHRVPYTTLYRFQKQCPHDSFILRGSQYRNPRDLGYKRYTQEALDLAMLKIHWGMSLSEAASKFNIPRSTLSDKQRQCTLGHGGRCIGAFQRQHCGGEQDPAKRDSPYREEDGAEVLS